MDGFHYSTNPLATISQNSRRNLRAQIELYLAEIVYGGIDGIVTTFAVVTASVSAQLSPKIIILLGFANLLADGFAMSVGSFLSARAKKQQRQQRRSKEAESPPSKRLESKFRRQGLQGEQLERALRAIIDESGDSLGWNEEDDAKPPFMMGLATYISFISLGFIPFMTYVFNFALHIADEQLFTVSCILTSIAFTLVGWLKSSVTNHRPWRSIAETLLLGGVAAAVAYGVGVISHNVF